GNHEIMMRGTFANVRLKNELVEKEGGVTNYFPENTIMSVFEAAERYKSDNISLLIIAGKEYGSGSSRDWAAKGVSLLGIRAIIAESFERIHRSNLVGMGVLPLQFKDGENALTYNLSGNETFDILNLGELKPNMEIKVKVTRSDGTKFEFRTVARLDSSMEVAYFKSNGILQYVLRSFLKSEGNQSLENNKPKLQ
ncbi:MAG TPA: aconitate hydratase, partial [Bacteroidales bacterium]|nr:aconitate hydratase [Bacteroidales bacterium]